MYTFKGIHYRAATKEDILGLTLFFTNVTKENNLGELVEHDIPLIKSTLDEILSENKGIIIVALKDDIIIGAIALGKMQLWWGQKDFFTNIVFYVAPEFRSKYRVQEKLLELTKDFSNEIKVPLLMNIFSLNGQTDKLARYLQIKGYKTAGCTVLYTPP